MSQTSCAAEVKATKCKYSSLVELCVNFSSLILSLLELIQRYALLHPHTLLRRASSILIAVTDLLAILTVVYEVFSAVFTTIRSYQALQVRENGGVHAQREGLTYLVFEQGMLTCNERA